MVSAIQSSGAHANSVPASVELSACGASPEARLLAVMVYSQVSQIEGAQTSVTLNQNQLEELRRQVREALEEARDADKDSGFWGDIADVLGGDIATLAGVVAMAAAAVATGGAAAAVLAAVAIGCSLAAKYGEELGLPPKACLCIGLVAVGASLAAGNVGALAQAGNAASAGAGAAQVGVGAAGLATQGASQASQLAQAANELARSATIIRAAATGAGAGANVVSGYYASEALDAQATATARDNASTLTTMSIDQAIDLLEEAIARQSSLCEAGNQVSTANQRADQLIIQNFARVA